MMFTCLAVKVAEKGHFDCLTFPQFDVFPVETGRWGRGLTQTGRFQKCQPMGAQRGRGRQFYFIGVGGVIFRKCDVFID